MESVNEIKEALSARSRTATLDELRSEGKKKVRLIRAEHVAAMVSEAVHAAIEQSGLIDPKEAERLVDKSRQEFRSILQERQQEAQHAHEVEEKLAAREAQLAELQARFAELTAVLADTQTQLGAARDAAAAEHAAGAALRTELAVLREQAGRLGSEAANCRDEALSRQREATVHRDEAAALRSELAVLREQAGRLGSEAASYRDEALSRQREATAHRDEAAALRETVARHESELIAARGTIGELEAELAALRQPAAPAPAVAPSNDLLLSLVQEMATMKASLMAQQAQERAPAAPAAPDFSAAIDKLSGALNDRLEKLGKKMGVSAAVESSEPLNFGGMFQDTGKTLESNMDNIEVKQKAGGGIAANLARLKKLKGGG